VEDVVPFVIKQQVDAQSKEVLELRRVRLQDREAAINESAEKVGDLEAKSPEFGIDQTCRCLKGERLRFEGRRRVFQREDAKGVDEEGDVVAEQSYKRWFIFLCGFGAE
jgi:hypothetical protein